MNTCPPHLCQLVSLLALQSACAASAVLELVVSLRHYPSHLRRCYPLDHTNGAAVSTERRSHQVAGILKRTRFEAIRRNAPISCVNTQATANGPANLWSDSNADDIEQPTEKQIPFEP
jgi:hypothetical protein